MARSIIVLVSFTELSVLESDSRHRHQENNKKKTFFSLTCPTWFRILNRGLFSNSPAEAILEYLRSCTMIYISLSGVRRKNNWPSLFMSLSGFLHSAIIFSGNFIFRITTFCEHNFWIIICVPQSERTKLTAVIIRSRFARLETNN